MSLKEKLKSTIKNISILSTGLSMLISCSTMKPTYQQIKINIEPFIKTERGAEYIFKGSYSIPNKDLQELGYTLGEGELCSVNGYLFNYKDSII